MNFDEMNQKGVTSKSGFGVLIRTALVFFILLFLIQCTAKQGAIVGENENEILRNRVKEFWNLQININPENADKVYRYEVPAYREKFSLLEYANRFRLIKYLDAGIEKIEIEGKKGKVTVFSTYRMGLPEVMKKNLTQTEVENWVKVEGAWYHIPKWFEMPDR